MKPKNSKERTGSILKFLILFICTVTLIVVAFFFDFDRLPFKENVTLRNHKASVERELVFQEKFSGGMTEISSLLDSLDIEGQNISHTNTLIDEEIGELKKSIPTKDSTYRYNMYTNIVDSYVKLQELKGKLKEYDEMNARIESYTREIDQLRTELSFCQRDLDAFRNSSRSGRRR